MQAPSFFFRPLRWAILFFLLPNFLQAQTNDTISLQRCEAAGRVFFPSKGRKGPQFLNVGPGSTIYIEGGRYINLVFRDFVGSAGAPITIRNRNGEVHVGHNHYLGAIDLKGCAYIRLTGESKENNGYGIIIDSSGTGSAIGLNDKSTDIEVDHIEIRKSGFAGILIKTDPTCDSTAWRDHFFMRNVRIHHNYIHHTGGEGIYAGNTAFSRQINCGGHASTVYPHTLTGLKIDHNRIEYTGADGLQIALSPDAEVSYNTILHYGVKPFEANQNSGIQLGGGSGGRCVNNTIAFGEGNGISVIGISSNFLICNNLMQNIGACGIFIDDRPEFTQANTQLNILNNTFLDIKMEAVRTYAEPFFHRLWNNAFIDVKASQPVMKFPAVRLEESNSASGSRSKLKTAKNGKPSLGSSLINAGRTIRDFSPPPAVENNPRFQGKAIDVGAFEWNEGGSPVNQRPDKPVEEKRKR